MPFLEAIVPAPASNLSSFERERGVRIGPRNGVAFSEEERQRWESWCQELIAEREALRAELARLKDDRQRDTGEPLPAPSYDFTEQELFAAIAGQPSMTDFLHDLRRREGL
jgi:hypothetical protein